MLQQDEPEDFVLATGETHPVREYVDKAFGVVGMTLKYVRTFTYTRSLKQKLITIASQLAWRGRRRGGRRLPERQGRRQGRPALLPTGRGRAPARQPGQGREEARLEAQGRL
jgi:hypothetical protein